MKGIVLSDESGLDRARVVELPDPRAPGAGEVRVRIRATSLNPHDWHVVKNGGPATVGRIPMADGAGIVEAIGPGVTEFADGDFVVSTFFPLWLDGRPPFDNFATVPGDGVDGYAREVVVRPASWFTRAPAGWSHAETATLTTAGLTAWRALVEEGRLKGGDTVLTLGTGGVSIAALQIAKSMGARVIVTSSSDAKLERATSLGADAVVNYRRVPEWGAAVRQLTDGRGVDHVVETVGPGTLPQSIVAARTGGIILLIGALTGIRGDIPTMSMMIKQVRLQGLIVGSRRQQQDMIRALESTGIRPVIDRTFPLEQLPEAFRYQESAAHVGKISVEV